MSKYGLSRAHHVLLEGTSFPPERRSSIVQSLGPMTAWICMLTSDGRYRNKYAATMKRAMSHLPGIDDIIELTKTTKQASEISGLTTLVAEILLVTTARQATRMFFPITVFANVCRFFVRKILILDDHDVSAGAGVVVSWARAGGAASLWGSLPRGPEGNLL